MGAARAHNADGETLPSNEMIVIMHDRNHDRDRKSFAIRSLKALHIAKLVVVFYIDLIFIVISLIEKMYELLNNFGIQSHPFHFERILRKSMKGKLLLLLCT